MDENTRYITTVKATDVEGDTLTYALAPGFDSFYLKIDPNTGVLEFKFAPDYENPHDLFHNNVYEATVIVSDGNGGFDAQLVTVNVQNTQNEQTGDSGPNNMTGINNRTNYLSGLGDDDTLVGRNRADVLSGGTGNDTLTGNGGQDTFVFKPNFGHDTITDFNTAADTIEIDNTLFANFADLLAHTTDVAGNAVIALDANNTITLSGVLKAALAQSDFHFV
jgi:Ca2+-binding RTX toxin-like protein